MAKFKPAALAILGILWLVHDLYALKTDQRFPPQESDFYFNDPSIPRSYPGSNDNAPSSFPRKGMPLQPETPKQSPNDYLTTPQQDDKNNKDTKMMNDNNSSGKADDNESASEEKNIKKLLKNFVDLLLNLNNKEDSLMRQLTSYLANENDQPPKDVPELVETSSTVKSIEPNINVTTFAPTILINNGEGNDTGNNEGNDNTSKIPQTTITNVIVNNNMNTTPNPVQYNPNGLQTIMPVVNNYKPIDFFQYNEKTEINPNNEFIDDIINSPKNTSKSENDPKIVPETEKLEEKPINQIPINENTSNYSAETNYQTSFIAENSQTEEKQETSENQMLNQQIFESQIFQQYPPYQQNFRSKPNSFIPQITNNNRIPSYRYEPIPNIRNQMLRPTPKFLRPKIRPLLIKNYNQQNKNGFNAPKRIYIHELQPQPNQPQSNVFSGTEPLIPKYPIYQNPAIFNYNTVNPSDEEKNEVKIPEKNINGTTPSDELPIQNNFPGDTTSPEIEKTSLASTETASSFNQTEMTENYNASTTEVSPLTENNFYSTEAPAPTPFAPSNSTEVAPSNSTEVTPSNSTEVTPTNQTPLNSAPSRNPRNISLPFELKQSTDAPENVCENPTLTDDLHEMDSKESEDDDSSSESDDTDDEEPEDSDGEPDENDEDEPGNTDDDASPDTNDGDGSNDDDKEEENISNNDTTTEVPQSSSISDLNYSTASPQNQTSDLNEPVPSNDESQESGQNPSVPQTDDSNEAPENTSISSTNSPTESPIDVDQNTESTNNTKGPPYDAILDYIYSRSKSAFFKEVKEQNKER